MTYSRGDDEDVLAACCRTCYTSSLGYLPTGDNAVSMKLILQKRNSLQALLSTRVPKIREKALV